MNMFFYLPVDLEKKRFLDIEGRQNYLCVIIFYYFFVNEEIGEKKSDHGEMKGNFSRVASKAVEMSRFIGDINYLKRSRIYWEYRYVNVTSGEFVTSGDKNTTNLGENRKQYGKFKFLNNQLVNFSFSFTIEWKFTLLL